MISSQPHAFLFHYSPPIGMAPEPFLLLLAPHGYPRVVTLQEVSDCPYPLVTYSFDLLVDWLRHTGLPLPQLAVDVRLAKKLLVGQPKREFERSPLWEPWELLEPYLTTEDRLPAVRRYLSTQFVSPDDCALGNSSVPLRILQALSRLWTDLQVELDERGEVRRFLDVEVPVYNVMLRSQYLGICVDEAQRDKFIAQSHKTYLSAHHKLAIGHGLNVERALKDVAYLQEVLRLPQNITNSDLSVHQFISLNKNHDERCGLLHAVRSARRNRAILLRTFSESSEKCFPVFDTIGTVSGRILAVDPQLQYLKKTYRSAIVPRRGRRLLYADYSQFEPTILANMSEDKKLRAMCQAGDLYVALAEEVFGNPGLRKEAKTLFLAYSYGMGEQGLAELACQVIRDQRRAARSIRDKLIRLFSDVEGWKHKLHEELRQTGRVGTSFGNYRHRCSTGDLNSGEKRWAVSQVVQGTGALILKRLIIRIASLQPTVNILLPMHDALLLEIPDQASQEVVANILQHYHEAFLEVCPSMAPRVTIEPFAKD